ncbi:MAG TPA: hypothetical protein VFZ66_09450 [Herpetosiphonaceae bacterium]
MRATAYKPEQRRDCYTGSFPAKARKINMRAMPAERGWLGYQRGMI